MTFESLCIHLVKSSCLVYGLSQVRATTCPRRIRMVIGGEGLNLLPCNLSEEICFLQRVAVCGIIRLGTLLHASPYWG